MSLQGKHIILGISGSIAAYKSAFLARLLVKAGAEVRVIMTEAATEFISPLTLSTLTKNAVYTSLIDGDAWNDHVELGIWGDLMVVAPATANTLAQMSTGLCNSVLSAVYLSARCPVFIAPAMDLDMWAHPSTQRNIYQLQQDGVQLIQVGHGALASGLSGAGRMAEPETIFASIDQYLSKDLDLTGKTVLVTAGPTYEAIDPVRFIGNHSSGKMGVALADELASRGADVELVLGPSKQNPTESSVRVTRVTSTAQMHKAALEIFASSDIAILSAAVADYRPAQYSNEKIKKEDLNNLNIPLERTQDIAAELGRLKKDGQIIVGFALETGNEVENARKKLVSKNMDMIVLNSLKDAGAGFDFNTNKVTIIRPDNKTLDFELKSKRNVAIDIINELVKLITNRALST